MNVPQSNRLTTLAAGMQHAFEDVRALILHEYCEWGRAWLKRAHRVAQNAPNAGLGWMLIWRAKAVSSGTRKTRNCARVRRLRGAGICAATLTECSQVYYRRRPSKIDQRPMSSQPIEAGIVPTRSI